MNQQKWWGLRVQSEAIDRAGIKTNAMGRQQHSANISRLVSAVLWALSCGVAFGATAPPNGAPLVDLSASAVAAPDAAGAVDPRRALLLRAVFART